MNFETSSHFLVSHARRAVPKVWKPVLLLSMRRRKAEWLHVWWRTDGGWPKISLVPQSSTVLEINWRNSSHIHTILIQKLGLFVATPRSRWSSPFWPLPLRGYLQQLAEAGRGTIGSALISSSFQSSSDILGLDFIRYSHLAGGAKNVPTFHSISFFFGRFNPRSGQTKIGSTVCWFISSASADSCPHRLMIEFPSLCFRSIWLDFGYPGDCRSLSHYCHLYPFIALLALWTLWTGYGKSLTISGSMVISTL